MKSVLVLCGLLASSATAHMQMSEPLPIRSPLNKDSKGKKDYSYTSPLSTDGSDYPCKGYADDPFNATADYSPGKTYDLKLQGSATHRGGSCQISLSYDKGKNFHVIHSMLGGCPIDKEYKFTVPSDAPSGEALLAWSWFNKVGNREMYMNCAQVNIGGDGGSQKRDMDKENDDAEEAANSTMTHDANSQSFDSLPPIFIANVNGPGKCETIEGKDVNFPRPGPSVEGSAEGKGYECDGDADFLGKSNATLSKSNDNPKDVTHANNASVHKANDDKHPKHEDNKSDDKKANNNDDDEKSDDSILDSHASSAPTKKHAQAFGNPAAFGNPHTWRGGHPNGQGEPHGDQGDHEGRGEHHHDGGDHHPHGKPGAIVCSDDGKSFSRIMPNGPPVHMGPVAAGTVCRRGAIERA